MLLPNELKAPEFSRAMRGYSFEDVDEYIDYIKKRYSELYSEKAESDRKLAAAIAKLEEYRAKEQQINKLRIEARDLGNALIAKTKDKCAKMISDAEAYAAQVNAELDREAEAKRAEIRELCDSIIAFRDNVFDLYGTHIESLQKLTEETDKLVSKASDNGSDAE